MLSSKQISKITKLKSNGLSQREIAKKIGITQNTVIKYSNPKIVKQALQRNEIQTEKIETIKEAIKETRQDSKAIRKELKRARSQQDRADDTYDEAWYRENERNEAIEKTISDVRKQTEEDRKFAIALANAQWKWEIEHPPPDDRLLMLLIALTLRRR